MGAEAQRVVVVPETFEVRVAAARMVTPRVRELAFERVDQQPFHFRSGQWVSLIFPLVDEGARPLRRSYSIASVPAPSPRFELVVTKVDGGRGSTWLHEVQVGDTLQAKGPMGAFARADDAGPSLFVATGTGVAPFRGMVHDAIAHGGDTPLWMLFGVRTPNDALYREEFEAIEQAHPRFRFLLTLSRPPPGWSGRTGYVQTHVLDLWRELNERGRPEAYVCGVKKMLFEVQSVLKTQGGAERKQLHLERYD